MRYICLALIVVNIVYAQHGVGNWRKILDDRAFRLENRTNVHLKDRWRNVAPFVILENADLHIDFLLSTTFAAPPVVASQPPDTEDREVEIVLIDHDVGDASHCRPHLACDIKEVPLPTVGAKETRVMVDKTLPLSAISAGQKAAWDAAMRRKSVFITGAAGTGKSFLLRAIITDLEIRGVKTFATAATGVAACELSGMTLHAFAGIGLGDDSVEQVLTIERPLPFFHGCVVHFINKRIVACSPGACEPFVRSMGPVWLSGHRRDFYD